MREIRQFAQQVKEQFGLARFELDMDRHGIELVMIEVPRDARKKGTGAAVMKALTDYADNTGALIWLSVADRDSKTGTTSRARLVKFYRQFGFVPNTGRNKRFDLSMYANMYRDPKGLQEEINEIRRRAGLTTLLTDDLSQEYPQHMSADAVFEYVESIHHTPEDIHDGDIYEKIQAYGEYQLTELQMDDVNHQEWSIDDERVADYISQIRTSNDYPPIVFDPIAKSIIDGTHRANALHQVGAKTIRAYAGIPQTARSWEEINSLLGLDDIDEEICNIRRSAGLPIVTG